MIKNKISAVRSAISNNADDLKALATAAAVLTVSTIVIVKLTPTDDETESETI